MLFIDTWLRTFSVMFGHALLCLQITTADIRPQVKLAVSLVIADGVFNVPQSFYGYTCIWISVHLYLLYHLRGYITCETGIYGTYEPLFALYSIVYTVYCSNILL